MSQTITIRLTKELAAWLDATAAKTGLSQGKIIRDQLEKARQSDASGSFMRLAGVVPRTEGLVATKRIRTRMKGIADTGFLVAFANRSDDFHDWAVGVAGQVSEPLLTCEAVLAETAYHLQSVPLVLDMIDEHLITLAFDVNDHLPQLRALADRYADRHPDLADLCLIRMSELFPQHPVITIDRTDFVVYRRNKRETIPLICPPQAAIDRGRAELLAQGNPSHIGLMHEF